MTFVQTSNGFFAVHQLGYRLNAQSGKKRNFCSQFFQFGQVAGKLGQVDLDGLYFAFLDLLGDILFFLDALLGLLAFLGARAAERQSQNHHNAEPRREQSNMLHPYSPFLIGIVKPSGNQNVFAAVDVIKSVAGHPARRRPP